MSTPIGPIAGTPIVAKPTGRPKRPTKNLYSQYQDGGCELAPSCLDWPLEECQYDSPEYRARSAWGEANYQRSREARS